MLVASCFGVIVFCSVLLIAICVYVTCEYFSTYRIAYLIMCVVCGFVASSALGFISDYFLGML